MLFAFLARLESFSSLKCLDKEARARSRERRGARVRSRTATDALCFSRSGPPTVGRFWLTYGAGLAQVDVRLCRTVPRAWPSSSNWNVVKLGSLVQVFFWFVFITAFVSPFVWPCSSVFDCSLLSHVSCVLVLWVLVRPLTHSLYEYQLPSLIYSICFLSSSQKLCLRWHLRIASSATQLETPTDSKNVLCCFKNLATHRWQACNL